MSRIGKVDNMIIEKVYNIAPVWFQNIMCSTKGWLLQRRRFGKGFFAELQKLEAGQVDPEHELSEFLKGIRNVPAYAEVFKAAERDGREVRLGDFPIINKRVVKERIKDFYNPDFHGPMFLNHTSGTTGSGIVFPNSVAYENRQWAVWWRYREALGIKFGTWCAWFGCAHMVVPINEKKPPFWRINRPGRQVMFSPYHLTAENVGQYIGEIERRQIPWVHGYASHVRFLAKLALERGVGPVDCVKFVTTGAENLLPDYIVDIKKVFPNAIVRQHYGQTEGVANFSQTKDGDWVIDDDFAKVEFIPYDASNPERCRIVGTSFSNLAFPLVRYDIGDVAIVKWVNGEAKVVGIEGRDNEYFIMKDGTKISTMRVYDIFKEAHNVIEAQLRIHGDDAVEMVVVKGEKYGESDEKEILALAKKYLSKALKISIGYVDKIERSASGKFRAIVKGN